jgi:hypothetical protein
MVRPLARSTKAAKVGVAGFSLVELMVALIFTLFLMSGLAAVFKASLTAFYASGENISNTRRNRMSIDLLSGDIDAAGMYLMDLTIPPQTLAGYPPFYIIPNAPIINAGADDPKNTDELYFYMDEPLPFEGVIKDAPSEQTAAEAVMSGSILNRSSSSAYVINCPNSSFAKQIKAGQAVIFKDFWEVAHIKNVMASGRSVTITVGATPNSDVTGSGASGLPPKAKHMNGAGVLFVKPAQMVRYRIRSLGLDPDPGATNSTIPCLVREQGVYDWIAAGFTATEPQQIITENVSGFKVYLSVNGGNEWAGLGFDGTGFDGGWNATAGIRGQLDSQLKVAGRLGFRTTRGDEHWFRSIPTLVRIDITTRTATRRAEFSAASNELAHRELMQSLIFVPKHFGLPMN